MIEVEERLARRLVGDDDVGLRDPLGLSLGGRNPLESGALGLGELLLGGLARRRDSTGEPLLRISFGVLHDAFSFGAGFLGLTLRLALSTVRDGLGFCLSTLDAFCCFTLGLCETLFGLDASLLCFFGLLSGSLFESGLCLARPIRGLRRYALSLGLRLANPLLGLVLGCSKALVGRLTILLGLLSDPCSICSDLLGLGHGFVTLASESLCGLLVLSRGLGRESLCLGSGSSKLLLGGAFGVGELDGDSHTLRRNLLGMLLGLGLGGVDVPLGRGLRLGHDALGLGADLGQLGLSLGTLAV